MQLLRGFKFWFLVGCLTSCTTLAPFTTTSTFSTLIPDPSETPTPKAEVIFTNGTILTMDDAMPQPGTNQHAAIAILGGKILAVGANQDVLKFQGATTQLIDLEGRVLMPGFVDAHNRLFDQHLINRR
jgi:hypothetical protein